MKKSTCYISVLAAISMLFFSCTIDKGADPLPKTSFAYHVYSKTSHTVLNYYITVIDLVQGVELWVNATNDQERYMIEDRYFPNNKVRIKDNIFEVVNLMSVEMDEKDFSEIGAKWKVLNQTNQASGTVIEIETVGENEWEIKDESTKIDEFISSVDIVIGFVDSYEYTIGGKGEYYSVNNRDKNFYKITYDIVKTLKVSYYNQYNQFYATGIFYDGAIGIEIERSEEVKNGGNEIYADLSLGNNMKEVVKIHYLGLTEMW